MNENIIVSLDIFIIYFASDTRISTFREIFPKFSLPNVAAKF